MNQTTLKIENQTKVCKVCGRELPLSEFGHSHLGVYNTCKECTYKKSAQTKADKKLKRNLEEEISNARLLRLNDFTPRELMTALKKMGYDGKLIKIEKHVIDLSNL